MPTRCETGEERDDGAREHPPARREALEAPGRADPEEMPHDEPEIARRGGQHVALLDILDAAEPPTPLVPAPAGVRKAPFTAFRS